MNNPLSEVDPKYLHILSNAVPFIVTNPENLPHFDITPWGISIPQENIFSCLSQKNEVFFDLLHTLDDLTFGPMGMPMEKWIFFDCAEMPGGIFGLSVHARTLHERILKKYKIPSSYDGPIPISMYMAIPMLNKNTWFGHNLSSANNFLRPPLPGLGLFTKAMALKVFNVKTLYGATQWDSKALHIHLQLSDMQIMSAYTPAHTIKKSLCYKSYFSDEILLQSLEGKPRKASKWDLLVPSDDEPFIIDLQSRIEKGESFHLVGRSLKKEGKLYHPTRKGELRPLFNGRHREVLV